jgi:hypothetical protein
MKNRYSFLVYQLVFLVSIFASYSSAHSVGDDNSDETNLTAILVASFIGGFSVLLGMYIAYQRGLFDSKSINVRNSSGDLLTNLENNTPNEETSLLDNRV